MPTAKQVQENMRAANARVQQQRGTVPPTPVTLPDDAPRHLNRIIRERDLPAFTGLRKSQIAAMVREGNFPKPLRLTAGGRAKGWLESELVAWQTALLVKREAGE